MTHPHDQAPAPLTAEVVTEMQRDMVAGTPGPWEWGGHPSDLKLQTVYHGKTYVMTFERKGMRGAQPCFQPKRRGMVPASDLLQFCVGDRSIVGEANAKADDSVYRYDVRGIDAPGARRIARLPDIEAGYLALATQLAEREKELARVTARRDEALAFEMLHISVLEKLHARIATLTELVEWASDTLIEINPSNYGHDDVCNLNDKSVEVILALSATLTTDKGAAS